MWHKTHKKPPPRDARCRPRLPLPARPTALPPFKRHATVPLPAKTRRRRTPENQPGMHGWQLCANLYLNGQTPIGLSFYLLIRRTASNVASLPRLLGHWAKRDYVASPARENWPPPGFERAPPLFSCDVPARRALRKLALEQMT